MVAARKTDSLPDVLLLCEHPHVITLGRNGRRKNLLASEDLLQQMDVEFFAVERGGDITYHGPGQAVGYPVLNLAAIRRDVLWYVRQMEEALIQATGEYGIAASRQAGMTGVWVGDKKLAAIGVHLSRWVTSHGFAYNVATDLRYFDLIVPCGILDKRPASLEQLLGRRVAVAEVHERIVRRLGEVYGLTMRRASDAERNELVSVGQPETATLSA
jgi:lipoate-protein ligase B